MNKERYEGDYGCSGQTDTKCRNVATQVWREPYTPKAFKVPVCDECSDWPKMMG